MAAADVRKSSLAAAAVVVAAVVVAAVVVAAVVVAPVVVAPVVEAAASPSAELTHSVLDAEPVSVALLHLASATQVALADAILVCHVLSGHLGDSERQKTHPKYCRQTGPMKAIQLRYPLSREGCCLCTCRQLMSRTNSLWSVFLRYHLTWTKQAPKYAWCGDFGYENPTRVYL